MCKRIKYRIAYNRLVKRIESEEIYDGRGAGVDVYICEECGAMLLTRYKDKGVTPFITVCSHDNGAMYRQYSVSEAHAQSMKLPIRNWYRPTFKEMLKLNDGTIEHVLNGGLILEE